MGVIDAAGAVLEEVHSPRPIRYLDLPYPSKLDERILSLVEAYRIATELERIAARSLLDGDASNCLWTFAKRSAIQGVRRSSESLIFDGRSALIVEDLREDDRVTRMVMSIIINAAVRLGIEPAALIERAVTFATPNTAERVLAIGKRYQDTKNSSLMGFREGFTNEGFTYF